MFGLVFGLFYYFNEGAFFMKNLKFVGFIHIIILADVTHIQQFVDKPTLKCFPCFSNVNTELNY